MDENQQASALHGQASPAFEHSGTPPSAPRAAPPVAAPETISQIIYAVADRAEPIIKICERFLQQSLQAQEARARLSIWMSLIAVVIVLFIVAVAGVLTYFGKVGGSTFTFLLGLIVGYVLTFVRDSIQPPKGQ